VAVLVKIRKASQGSYLLLVLSSIFFLNLYLFSFSSRFGTKISFFLDPNLLYFVLKAFFFIISWFLAVLFLLGFIFISFSEMVLLQRLQAQVFLHWFASLKSLHWWVRARRALGVTVPFPSFLPK